MNWTGYCVATSSMPRHPKRPPDPNHRAKLIAGVASGEVREDEPSPLTPAREFASSGGYEGAWGAVRADLKLFEMSMDARFQSLEAKIEILRRDIIVRSGGMLVVAVSIILTAMRYMPPRL
jgi:hypothetical protein